MTVRETYDALLETPLVDIMNAVGAFAIGMTVVLAVAVILIWLFTD